MPDHSLLAITFATLKNGINIVTIASKGIMLRILLLSVLLLSCEVLQAGMSHPRAVYEYHAQLSLEDATKKVQDEQKGRVLGAKVKKIDGKKFYVIKVLTEEGRIRNYRIDSESGQSSSSQDDK